MADRKRGRTFVESLRYFKLKVAAKTADYTVVKGDSGTVFHTRGAAGAVIFTLPAASGNNGMVVWIYNAADQNITVAGTAGELVVMNDLAANSVALSTLSEKAGGGFMCVCDGTKWFVFPSVWADVAAAAQTATVVT